VQQVKLSWLTTNGAFYPMLWRMMRTLAGFHTLLSCIPVSKRVERPLSLRLLVLGILNKPHRVLKSMF